MQLTTLVNQVTVTGDGDAVAMTTQPLTIQAHLNAAGGTATVNVYGRMQTAAPWVLLWTASLSGANDTASYILDEVWGSIKGNVSAISSAVVTITAGG